MIKVLWLLSTLLLWGAPGPPPQPITDAEIARGIQQVDEGDYETAILTLDAATKRLAGRRDRAAELGQAYLYLGIAYLGKGHETLAKARFRDALAQAQDLNLDPDKFAPKVLELFEKAKEESASPTKKKGSKTALIVVGVGGAAAAGVAVAAGGGSSGTPVPQRRTRTETAVLTLAAVFVDYPVPVSAEGTVEAEVSWLENDAHLHMSLGQQQSGGGFTDTAKAPGTGLSPLRVSAVVPAGNYSIRLHHRLQKPDGTGFTPPLSTRDATFTLRWTYP